MINTKLRAEKGLGQNVRLYGSDGDGGEFCVATFHSMAHFYIVTGFKTVESYNENQDDQPTKFLVWKNEH